METATLKVNDLPEMVDVSPVEAITRAERDMNFLAALCFAEHMKFLFPALFVACWEFMKSKVNLIRSFPQLAIGIPRGFAKTTVMKLWIIYCVLFTSKRFIVVISKIEDHAINIIMDVCEMLSHPNITSLFGMWNINIERDQQQCKIFSFRGRKIILGAIGAKGSIRGLNIGNERPDVMIFEDYQSKEDSENEELSNKQYETMVGTFMKACAPFGCMYIFVANMYPTVGSILKKLKTNPDWMSFIVGAILADGTSLWEDLQPIEQLIDEYMKDLRAGVPQVFLAEKLNDENAGIKAGNDIMKIGKFPFDPSDLPQGRAIVIDPALDNPTSDYNGVGLVGLYDGIPVLEKVILGKFTPLALIKQALMLGFNTGTRLITVENVAYQASLLFWFNQVCQDNGIQGFHFMPLNVGSKSKNSKIAASLKEIVPNKDGKIETYVKDEVRPLLINEIIKWQPLKKNNQDTVLDLLTFCRKVIEQFMDLMYMPYEPEVVGVALAAPRPESENCTF